MPARTYRYQGHGRFAEAVRGGSVGERTCKAVSLPIHLVYTRHPGIQSATLLEGAIESGVHRVVDVALASLSGLTSQPNFNVPAEALRNTPHATNFNIDSPMPSNYWETVREYITILSNQGRWAEIRSVQARDSRRPVLQPEAVS